jgi:hypothetical protein
VITSASRKLFFCPFEGRTYFASIS